MHRIARCITALTMAFAAASHAAPARPTHTWLPLVEISVNGKTLMAIAPADRIRLAREAAAAANLRFVGLDWKDLYAIVSAESDWSPRDAIGRNGKASRGLAQLEDSTARSLGVDPYDTKQALGAVAALLKEAAAWSRAKGHQVESGSMSVYYNLSTAARNQWDGEIESLPVETQRHIQNFKNSRLSAAVLERALARDEKRLERQMAAYIPRMHYRPALANPF